MIPKQLQNKDINFVLIEKEGKKPFQIGWQNKKIKFDDKDLIAHISKSGNYGVMGGGDKNLIIVDFDDLTTQKECMDKLPKTFMVKTGSGMLHLYYFSDGSQSFKIFNEEMDTLADIQGEGKQVVGASSKHPNGNIYEVINDVPLEFIHYAELKAILELFNRKPKKEEPPKKEEHKGTHIDDNFIDTLKRNIKVKDVLDMLSVNTSRNPTHCPFHGSKGGQCLGFQDDTCHCFHCDGSWNIFSLVMEDKKCDFKTALEVLAKLGNMETELEESRKRYRENLKQTKEYKFKKIKDEYLEAISGDDKGKWGKASELLVEFILEEMWIYTTKEDKVNEIWTYKNGIYVPQGRSEIKELLRDVLGSYYSIFIYNMVMAKIEPDTFIDSDKFFSSSYKDEVAVLNGILNIRTLKLKEFTPEKIFFNKLPVRFDIAAECPKIDSFLHQILTAERDVDTMYELASFGLLDRYKFEKAFMFHGNGRNGKGKLIELLKRLFGGENCCSLQLSALKQDSFSLSELFGKRLNLAGDIGNQDLKDTNMFKSLTGRDLVSAKRKFLRVLHFENSAKFVFACNELPMTYDLSKGFWDRWILIDFPFCFVTQEEYNNSKDKTNLKIRDEDIIEKICTPEELSGFLNQALIGLVRLEENHGFSHNENSEDLKRRWVRKSNSFIAFCWDMLADGYDSKIRKKELRKRYSEYCKVHKIAPKSDFVIKRFLQEEFGATEVNSQQIVGEIRVRDDYWEGIKWKQQE